MKGPEFGICLEIGQKASKRTCKHWLEKQNTFWHVQIALYVGSSTGGKKLAALAIFCPHPEIWTNASPMQRGHEMM